MAKKTVFRFEFESDFRIVGLFCNERDYRLSWLLNRYMLFNFSRVADFEFIPNSKKQPGRFSVFYYSDEVFRRRFYLVNNRSSENHLMFTQPAGLDYLMLVKADEDRFDFSALLKNIRAIGQFTAAYQLDNMLGKGRDAFLYDFELFADQKVEAPVKREGFFWSAS